MFIEKLFSDPLLFSSTVLIVLLSVTIHELAHGGAALLQGDSTPSDLGHMTLNPIKHMGWAGIVFLIMFGICWGSMPVNPSKFRNPRWGNFLVSFAGPAANLMVGILFTLAFFLVSYLQNSPNMGYANKNLILVLFQGSILNFTLFLFNLLPIPPLDGFHVFSEIFTPLKKLSAYSQYAFVVLLLLFNIPGFWRGISNIAIYMIEFLIQLIRFLFPALI